MGLGVSPRNRMRAIKTQGLQCVMRLVHRCLYSTAATHACRIASVETVEMMDAALIVASVYGANPVMKMANVSRKSPRDVPKVHSSMCVGRSKTNSVR